MYENAMEIAKTISCVLLGATKIALRYRFPAKLMPIEIFESLEQSKCRIKVIVQDFGVDGLWVGIQHQSDEAEMARLFFDLRQYRQFADVVYQCDQGTVWELL